MVVIHLERGKKVYGYSERMYNYYTTVNDSFYYLQVYRKM